MFSFQAIHNVAARINTSTTIVIYQCQCSLFKQFTTKVNSKKQTATLSFISVNVLFSSNSQHCLASAASRIDCHLSVSMFSFQAIHNCRQMFRFLSWIVIYQCQCSLFKQFTTGRGAISNRVGLSFISVNVLFSSNSQPIRGGGESSFYCHLSVSMFSFQAIHNSLAEQMFYSELSFISVNVLFSSNSQRMVRIRPDISVVIYQCQCSLFKQFTTCTCFRYSHFQVGKGIRKKKDFAFSLILSHLQNLFGARNRT